MQVSWGQRLSEALLVRPGDPRITYYGPAGERIEVSGHVLRQWVAKVANLLAEEADVAEGDQVWVVAPAHWLTAVVSGAAWALGAQVCCEAGSFSGGVVVTDAVPGVELAGADSVLAMTLVPLARAMPPQEPSWWDVDVVAGAMSCADDPLYDAPSTPLAPVCGEVGLGPGRWLVTAPGRWSDEVAQMWWATLAAGGSLVVVQPGQDAAAVAVQERATVAADPL